MCCLLSETTVALTVFVLVLNYRSYPKNKIGYRFFWNTLYVYRWAEGIMVIFKVFK